MISKIRHHPKFALVTLLILAVAYLVLRVQWYDRYPPALNYDHFNTETTLNVLRNPALYPTDPIWSGGGQAKSLGFLFVGTLQLVEAVFGEFTAAWTFLYAVHLLIFLPGAFLCFRYLTDNWWLSALMALISSLPFYLYFSYTNWGISSPYARTFVTVQIPWLFVGMFYWLNWRHTIAHNSPSPFTGRGVKFLQQYTTLIGLALAFSSMIVWNPVYGLGLIETFAFVLLVEWWGGRIGWRDWVIFIGITGGCFVLYYLNGGQSLNTSDKTPLSPAELDQVVTIWRNFAGFHFFPWAVTEQQALWVVIAASIGGALVLLTAPLTRLEQSQGWWAIGLIALLCQVPSPMIMTRDFSFLLIIGYWLYRYRRIDRWDVLLVSCFAATNLASLVQSALGFYLFSEHHILAMASISFEGYRPVRWDFWLLFLFVGRWCADLLLAYRKDTNDWPALIAIPFILGSVLSRVGHVGHDDGMIVRPVEQETLRQWLPFLGLAWAFVPRLSRIVGATLRPPLPIGLLLVSIYAAHRFATHLPDFYQTIPTTYGVGGILAVGLLLWGYQERARAWHWGVLGIFIAPMVILPISDYYRTKNDYNPSSDFNSATDWAEANTPIDALFLPLGLDAMPFRAHSERSVLTWDLPQTYYFVGPRAMLQSEAYFDPILDLNLADPSAVRQTLDGYPMDYVVANNSRAILPYPIVFYTPTVSIYYPVNKAERDGFYNLPNGGLSQANAEAFEAYQATFDLIPPDAPLLMPITANSVQRTETLQALAQAVEIETAQGITDHTAAFDLMTLFAAMRYQHEMELSPDQQLALDQWNATKQPAFLTESGIHYLLIDSRWWEALGEDQRAQLQDSTQYQVLGEWQGLVSPWIRLYHIQ